MRNELLHLHLPRPIAIVGLGISGEALLKLLIQAGVPRSEILTFDQKQKADFNTPETLLAHKPQTLCISPGVPLQSPWIQTALKTGLRLSSELEIAFSFLTSEKVIAITGSVGKSTTTALLGEGAKALNSSNFCGGNLGKPLADYACDVIAGKPHAEYVLLELSSYQLENFSNLKSDLSVFTFLSPNHLERYSSLQEYYDTKLSLLEKTRQWVVVNNNGGDCRKQIEALESRYSYLKFSFVDRRNLPLHSESALVGEHNLDNMSVAMTVVEKMQWPAKAQEAMRAFPGLAHRMENVGRFQNILFINDSKATTMDSVLQAFKSVQKRARGHVHLLLGGRDKNLPWSQLSVLKNETNLQIHFFGEFGEGAKTQSQLPGSSEKTLQQCLATLKNTLQTQDIVLLSPGGTSLDEFKNFEDRGDFFKRWVLSEFKN